MTADGSCRGTVGRAVTSAARCPQFESIHWQTFISEIGKWLWHSW